MSKKIVVAGSTGDLGRRIVKALASRDATVVALVRTGAKPEKIDSLRSLRADLRTIDMGDRDQIAAVCEEADCVISCVAGLRDVIVEAQTVLLEAAIQAGVARFIPSDFSTDFTTLPAGENRNFDLRRDFHKVLDAASIASTSIFNGAFAEILTYNIPVLDFKKKTVGYWGNPDHKMDFTTMDDTAAFTAAAALDAATPRALHIASFQVSANDLVRFTVETLGTPFQLVCMGSVEDLRTRNLAARAADPEGENELYSRWQQGQYLQSMFSTQHEMLDNGRYPDLLWTPIEEAVKPRT